MKRFISSILVIVMLFCLCLTAFADAPADFEDVAGDAWYRGNVIAARDLGLMQGVGGGLFAPNATLSVAEAVTLAARARSLYFEDGEEFKQEGEWYRVYADYAIACGMLKEEPEDWAAPATRAFIAELFAATLPEEALAEMNEVEDGAIPDVSPDAAAVYIMYRAGIMVGDGEHFFHPDDPILRCETAAVVIRLLKTEYRVAADLKPAPDSIITDPVPTTEPV